MIFSEGEFGFTHTFTALQEDGTNASISGFTGARLIIWDESTATAVLDITTNLTIADPDIQWAVQSGQTDYNGEFLGSLHLTSGSQNERVLQFPVIVHKKLVWFGILISNDGFRRSKLEEKNLIDLDNLEIVKKFGKTYVNIDSIPKKQSSTKPSDKEDDTLPEDVRALFGDRDDI